MAVIQLSSYDDFKAVTTANAAVYYWLDEAHPSWFAYSHLGNDWFWLFQNSTETIAAFKRDFAKAVMLQGGLDFK